MPSQRNPMAYEVGGFLHFESEKYVIVAIDSASWIFHVENINTHQASEIHLLDFTKVQDAIYADTLNALDKKLSLVRKPFSSPPEAGIPNNFLQEAKRRSEIVETVEGRLAELEMQSSKLNKTKATKEIVADFGICIATYYNYRGDYRRFNGDVKSIASSLRRSNWGKLRIPKVQQHAMDTVLLTYPTYSASKQLDIMRSLLKRTNNLWVDPDKCENIPENLVDLLMNPHIDFAQILLNPEFKVVLSRTKPVSRSKFYEYVPEFFQRVKGGKTIFEEKYGDGSWDKHMRVFDTSVQMATQPLQHVFGDYHLLDVFIVDTETRTTIDWLWLSTLMDAYSRSVVGWALLYEQPSIESIQDALLDTIWPKDYVKSLGIDGDWVAYGIPVTLSLDNAWGNHSGSLKSLSTAISMNGMYDSITLEYRTPYMARLGALIERFFGNISQQIKTQLRGNGAIISSHPHDVRNAAKQASLLYGDIYKYVLRMIVSYQNTPHSELNGMTPNQKWLEGMSSRLPMIPPRTEEVKRLFWRQYHGTRRLTRQGISLHGMHYSSPDFAGQAKFKINGKSPEYTVRYQPQDISRIAVYREMQYVGVAYAKELQLPDGSYASRSLAELQLAKAFASGNGEQFDYHDFATSAYEIKAVIGERTLEKKVAKKSPQMALPKRNVEFNSAQIDAVLSSFSNSESDTDVEDFLSKFAR